MDLHDFESQDLYFDEPLVPAAKLLLEEAADSYANANSELPLMKAYFLEPEHPMVLVALYRYFYYQHRYEDALIIANRVLRIFSERLEIPGDW